jgi:hypothetical protein
MSSRPLRALTLVAVAFALGSALLAAWRQGWTYDEPDHLEWSRRLVDEGTTERRSSLHFNSKTPIVVPNVLARKAAKRLLGVRDETALRFAARLPTVAWLCLLLATLFAVARRAFGEPAACAATILAALDPSLIAHGSLATVDVAYALATLVALVAAAAFAARPSAARGLALGLSLGFAFAVKFTAFLLPPLVLVVLLAWGRGGEKWSGRWLRIGTGLLLAGLVALAMVSAAYAFRRFGMPLSDLRWKSEAMLRLARAFPDLALPVPADFLTGLDLVLDTERRKPINVVILGGLHPDGVWYYFLVLWLLKTPVLALVAMAYGLVRSIRGRLWTESRLARVLGLGLLLHLAYFSLLFRYQTGYRFALMCVPLACLLAAVGLRPLLEGARGTRWAFAFVGLTLLEHGGYLGNPLAFTNALVWPKRQVFRLIADSNVDWGQNDEKIDAWLREAGVAATHLDPPHVLPGHNTIDLNLLAGVGDFEQHRWLREHADPRGHFGHTWLWFDVDPAQFQRFLGEARRQPADPRAVELCRAAGAPRALGSVEAVAMPEDRERVRVLCVRALTGTDLVLSGARGKAVFGLAFLKSRDWEAVEPGGEVWHRLEPGLHAFALGRSTGFEGGLRIAAGSATSACLEGRLDEDGVLVQGSLAPSADEP